MYIVLLTVDIYVAFILFKLQSHCIPLCLKIVYFGGYFWQYISLHTWLSSPSHLCHLPLKLHWLQTLGNMKLSVFKLYFYIVLINVRFFVPVCIYQYYLSLLTFCPVPFFQNWCMRNKAE